MAMATRGLREGQDAASIGPLYIVYFTGTHENFRLSEFQAGADYLDTAYAFVPVPVNRMPRLEGQQAGWRDAMDLTMDSEDAKRGINVQRPFMLVHLPSDNVARRLCERVTSIRSIWQQWASGVRFEEVVAALQTDRGQAFWRPYCSEKISWRAHILSFQRHLSQQDQLARVNRFDGILDLDGPIKMKGADMEWAYMEEWTAPHVIPAEEEGRLDLSQYQDEVREGEKGHRRQTQRLLSMHVGRKVSDGIAKDVVVRMDVKQRKYIGNTTMEAQMSLIQATMALSGPGKVVYDPFAGTCSILLAAAALRASVFASDIDGRMLRGKGKGVAVLESAKQYGVQDKFLGFCIADVSQHPWRRGTGLFDAIVADPPYGVRAGAKQLGRRDVEKQRREPFVLPDGTFSHEASTYIPPTKPYALDQLLLDLMNFSAKLLVPKGRLVFWMPTMIESASQTQELQLELTRDFRLIAHSLQDFGIWGRRLITLEKVQVDDHSSEAQGHGVLPSPPERHLQSTSAERLRATDDPNEFRNKVSEGR
jgi:tRNA (guanine10-N2)-methyltransferase